MNSYKPLFRINLLHDYYEGSSCFDLSIRPTPACKRILKRHRMIAKHTTAGIRIKTAVDEASETPFLPLAEGTRLSFLLELQNPGFHNFTALDKPAAGSIHLFSNNADQETLSHSEIIGAEARADRKSFALVEIRVTKGLFDTLGQEKKFVVHFKALEQFWKYYLITPSSSNDYSISSGTTNGPAAITFQKVIVDSFLATQDKVAEALLEEFPDQKTYLFTSTNEVALRAMGRKNIQLKRGENTLIRHLPNPPAGDQGIKILKL